MVTEDLRDFFVAAAGVAGALIGLLFVAISVSLERLRAHDDGPLHRVRASAALTAFTDALAVSLFALVPGALGTGSFAFALVGLAFVGGALLSLRRLPRWRWSMLRDLLYLAGLTFLFIRQLIIGLHIESHHSRTDDSNMALIVVFCALIGIARAWELIGGPSLDFRREAVDVGRELVRRHASESKHQDR